LNTGHLLSPFPALEFQGCRHFSIANFFGKL